MEKHDLTIPVTGDGRVDYFTFKRVTKALLKGAKIRHGQTAYHRGRNNSPGHDPHHSMLDAAQREGPDGSLPMRRGKSRG